MPSDATRIVVALVIATLPAYLQPAMAGNRSIAFCSQSGAPAPGQDKRQGNGMCPCACIRPRKDMGDGWGDGRGDGGEGDCCGDW